MNIKNRHHKSIALTCLLFKTAFTAISGRSKSTEEVWVAGAAVWMTAAAVPSRGTWIQTRDGSKATGDGLSLMAAQMVRVQRTMG